MSTCTNCGKQTSLLSSFCDDCKKKQKEIKLIEKKTGEEIILLQKEEKQQQLKEDVKTLVDVIVKSITPLEPLMYFFIQNDVKEKESNNIVGTVVGGTLGGITGAMMGVVFDTKTTKYTGNIGILVVTKDNIIIKYFNTKIYFPGCIHYEQLKQLLSNILSQGSIVQEKFEIAKSLVIENRIDYVYVSGPYSLAILSGNTSFGFNESQIYIDESNILELFSENKIVSVCNELGSLLPPKDFIEKLINKNNPINELQLSNIIEAKSYFKIIALIIIAHADKLLIIKNFTYLSETVRNMLVSAIKEQIKPDPYAIGCGSVSILVFIPTLILSVLNLQGKLDLNGWGFIFIIVSSFTFLVSLISINQISSSLIQKRKLKNIS